LNIFKLYARATPSGGVPVLLALALVSRTMDEKRQIKMGKN